MPKIVLGLILCFFFAQARTPFWAPLVPPRAHYAIEVSLSPDVTRLDGTARIRLANDTQRPIGRIAFRWYGDQIQVLANGITAARISTDKGVALFDLPADVPPGASLELNVSFGAPWKMNPSNQSGIASFLAPTLWWGFGTHDDYEVRVHVPDGYAIATSGRFDSSSGKYRARGIRTFGLFVGKGYQQLEADAGDVRVRTVFTEKGRQCGEALLQNAVDAISFYRQRLGFYPHSSLSIVPGMDNPAGGYPAASGLVVVHGQERFKERPDEWWRWITAHEIGHEYWSEHVLARGTDSLDWLMIGLGVQTDREYRRARKIATGTQWQKYVRGVQEGFDTTMDLTEDQKSSIKWDFNNVVTHGKSTAALNALESVVGEAAFDAAFRRCLREYAGRRLGWREFQAIVEAESGQELDWFFEQWVRSSKSAMYRAENEQCAEGAGGFECSVHLVRTGAMRMPVTVAARFVDGSEQRASTDRLALSEELHFISKTRLKEVAIEPDHSVALAEPPAAAERDVRSKISDLPWTGDGEQAAAVYRQATDLKLQGPTLWLKLGLALYDARLYEDALGALRHVEGPENTPQFLSLVWQGHVLDLLGRRAEALSRYEQALKIPDAISIRHDQYKMVIDKAWVQERLKSPFVRP